MPAANAALNRVRYRPVMRRAEADNPHDRINHEIPNSTILLGSSRQMTAAS